MELTSMTPLRFLSIFTGLLVITCARILHHNPGLGGAAPPPPSNTTLGVFGTAAVSTDGVPCSQIATDVLLKNGTAADATIAALFCVGVINAQSMGLGGGFLLTYYDRFQRKAYTLVARETAPAAAFQDMFGGDSNLSQKGGLAVGVPGEVRGYKALYDRFGGGVPWADLITPTIQLCEKGYPVNWHMARALAGQEQNIINEPSMSGWLNPATGRVWLEGDVMRRPLLAQTLKVLQEEPDALYTGSLANQFVQDLQNLGTIITADDLRNYQPEWVEPVTIQLNNGNYSVHSVPPPGSGLIFEFILNLMDEYNLKPDALDVANTEVFHQRFTEAMKWAFAKRTELGDAAFENMVELTKNLTSDNYAAQIVGQITDNQTFQDPSHYGAVTVAPPSDHGTAHISVLAPNGDAVSVTSTINLYMGAGIMSVQTDILLNDQMDDFSSPNINNSFGIPPSPANLIQPGKRPLSSMCPAVVVDNKSDVRLVLGAAGGTKISSATAWVALRNLWLGDDIKQAVDARRIHHQLFPMKLQYEDGFEQTVVSGLEALGHVTSQFGVGGSVVCAVERGQDGLIYANSDFRKAGEVDGF